MFDKEKIEIVCLRCKYFRVIDTVTGKCKIDKATTKKLPIMKHRLSIQFFTVISNYCLGPLSEFKKSIKEDAHSCAVVAPTG